MNNAIALPRIDANNSGEVGCVVFADSFHDCRRNMERFGVRIIAAFPFINAFGVTVKLAKRAQLQNIDQVAAVVNQTLVHTLLSSSKPLVLGKASVNSDLDGEGITIAVLDTGTQPHLDFVMPKNRIIAFEDFIGQRSDCFDDNGHGTFVTSVACGNGLLSNGRLTGFAPKANIISLKCMDQSGTAGAFKILQAMQWVYDNRVKYNIKVVCMSLGADPLPENDPLSLGAEILWKSGIVVVAAAGNSGPEFGSIKSPGICPSIITVGGAEIEGQSIKVAHFSSRGDKNGSKPDLVAPSVNINAASHNGGYCLMSGTSVAAPMVAGLCALILQKRNDAPDKIKYDLIKNAIPFGAREEAGFGLVSLDFLG